MVAYWIWPGTLLFGDTAFGVRLAAVLASVATSFFVWDGTRVAFSSRPAAALALLWLNCMLLFGATSVIITPDSPLLFFWSMALWGLIRTIETGRAWPLLCAGLALGLGAISKYTMALILPGLVVTFLLFRPLHLWWRRPAAWGAVALAALCLTPLLLWNLANHGASFAKQLGHAFGTQIIHPLDNLSRFLGSQIGLVTPLIFVFCLYGMVWSLLTGWRRNRPSWFLLGTTSFPILLFFIWHTRSGVVQAHWAGPAYLSGLMAAVGGWTAAGMQRGGRLGQRAFRFAPALGMAMTLLVFFQATTALLPIPMKADALKRLGGWDELAQGVEEERRAHPGVFLFTQKHEPTGPVSFHLADHAPVFLQGPIRPSYVSAQEILALKGRTGLFITRVRDDGAKDLGPYFDKVVWLRRVDMHWGGRMADAYNLYLAENYHGGLFVVGDGFEGTRDDP
jgi:hypothetical protein